MYCLYYRVPPSIVNIITSYTYEYRGHISIGRSLFNTTMESSCLEVEILVLRTAVWRANLRQVAVVVIMAATSSELVNLLVRT